MANRGMQLPVDQVVHSGLRTTFVRFDGLLGSLREREFTGWVRVDTPGFEGRVFFADGRICGRQARTATQDWPAGEAMRMICDAAGNQDGEISVYAAPAPLMRLSGSMACREALYEGLSTDYVDLSRLVETLAREGHSGYVEITFRHGGQAYLFLTGGEVVDAVLADETQAGSGLRLVGSILKAAAPGGAAVNVWSVDAGQPMDEAIDVELPGEPAVPYGAIHPADKAFEPEHGNPVMACDEEETRQEEVPGDLGATWGAILGAVEQVVDAASEAGRFGQTLREVQLDRSPDYPYLDPFAAEFEYASGRVIFRSAPPEHFNQAMGECLGDAIARVSFRLRKADLERLIHQELATVLSTHHEAITRNGIDRAATSFLAA